MFVPPESLARSAREGVARDARNSVLVGSVGTGRSVIAGEMARLWGVGVITLKVRGVDDVRAARDVLSVRRPQLIVLRMDGASSRVGDTLLKVLEENEANRIVLIWDKPSATIRSRCAVIPCGRMSDAEVMGVLMVVHGVHDPDRAELAASLSGGVPEYGLKRLEMLERGKSRALSVIRSAVEGDEGLLQSGVVSADEDVVGCMWMFVGEALRDEWRVFSKEDVRVSRERLAALMAVLSIRERPISAVYAAGRGLRGDEG